MRGFVPESRKCLGCGMMHPAPFDANCPINKGKIADIKPITEFNTWLLEHLPNYSNSKALIESMKKLIELKGVKKK